VNAHAGSETADFIGSMRPVRGKEKDCAQLKQALLEYCNRFNVLTQNISKTNDLGDYSELDALMSEVSNAFTASSPTQLQSDAFSGIIELNNRRKRLFEWRDGPLVQALKSGDIFLLDEISLADDSVLERLNSVLETNRILVITEAAAHENSKSEDSVVINAADSFAFLATMNPGGDFGKKELSPALRNRFTEIWVSPVSDRQDLIEILSERLIESGQISLGLSNRAANSIIDFIEWLSSKVNRPLESIFSLRDILAWVSFISCSIASDYPLSIRDAFIHGGLMVFVDSIGVNPLIGISRNDSGDVRKHCVDCLKQLAKSIDSENDDSVMDLMTTEIIVNSETFGIPPFTIRCGPYPNKSIQFALHAPTTCHNAQRVLRGMQLRKPILLEGSPGVGKTSLISAIATASGRSLCRINFSEQTDLMDLFGSDLPTEGGKPGDFSWIDGPLLRAIKHGEWVLLDELNLASQQVLEVIVH
jgi:midasin